VLWNPASLGKLELSEASLSFVSAPGSYNYERTDKVSEQGGEFDLKEGSGTSGGRYGIFYRYPQDVGPGLVTREIEVMSHSNYAAAGGGMNFTSALKVNDWLSVGFAANSPIAAEINMAGDFPVTSKATMNMLGQTVDQTEITTDGKLRFTYTNGVVVTYESTAAIWGGFLSQEAVIPVLTYSEFRNNMNIQSPYTGSIASKYNNFYFGLNMIPINASANINNDARAIVSSDTQDIYLYYPNFDPDNQTDINNWVNDPARYGSSEGYLRRGKHREPARARRQAIREYHLRTMGNLL
jgi:hypothetical protein